MDWFPDWSGDVCAIVASGESATPDVVEQLKGKARVIVINNSYRLAPWADVLYAADGKWWESYPSAAAFAGMKITTDDATAKRLGIHLVRVVPESDPLEHSIHVGQRGLLGRGGHSGFQAINLEVQFYAKKILLVGFDFCGGHWHDKHPAPLKNPSQRTLDKWRKRIDAQYDMLVNMGVEVVNASSISMLERYAKGDVASTLARWGR